MPTSQIIRVVQSEDQKGNLITQLKIPLGADAIGNGNNGAVQVSGADSVTFTVKDSGGSTWTKRQNVQRTGGQFQELWTRENITDAPTFITIDASGSGSGYLAAAFIEACGVGAYDTGSTGNGTSTTPAVGSFTPTAGALILETSIQDSDATFLTSWTPDSGYTALYDNLVHSFLYGQWRLHTSGAITPGSTMSASRGWSALAISWLANTSNGTAAPAKAYPAAAMCQSFDGVQSTSFVFGLPSVGASSLGILFEVAPGITITGITDTEGNTWTRVDSVTTSIGGTNDYWKTTNTIAGSNSNVVTATFTGSTGDNFIVAYRFVGTPANAVSQAATKTSGNNVSTSTQAGATTTPTGSNWLIVSLLGVQSNTVTAVNLGSFTSVTSTPTVGSPAPLMQNNGYRQSRSSGQATWTLNNPPGDWQELNIIIDASSAGVTLTQLERGTRGLERGIAGGF